MDASGKAAATWARGAGEQRRGAREVVRVDDYEGRGRIGVGRVEREDEARPSGADIGGGARGLGLIAQPVREPQRRLPRRGDVGAARHVEIAQDLRPLGQREELLLHARHLAQPRADHGRDRQRRDQGRADDPVHDPRVAVARTVHQRAPGRRLPFGAGGGDGPDGEAGQQGERRQEAARQHEHHDDAERVAVLPLGAVEQEQRQEGGDGGRGRDQQRCCVLTAGGQGGLVLCGALLDAALHVLDDDDAVVHQEAEADDDGGDGDLLDLDPERPHQREGEGDREGHDGGHHQRLAPAEEQQHHAEHHGEGLRHVHQRAAHRGLDDVGLEGREGGLDPDGLGGREVLHRLAQHGAERGDVLALSHLHAQHDRGRPVLEGGRRRRLGQLAPGP